MQFNKYTHTHTHTELGARTQKESKDTKSTNRYAGSVIDLAHNDDDPTPLQGDLSTSGLHARANGLPQVHERLPGTFSRITCIFLLLQLAK